MTPPADSKIMVGAIMGAHGVRGQVKVKCFMEVPADFTALDAVYFGDTGADAVNVSAAYMQKQDILIVTFDGVADRDQAQALKSTQLFVERAQVSEDEDPDAFFLSDLEGLRVVDDAKRVIGVVKAVNNFGAADVLEIALEGSTKTAMLPFIEDAVPEVDLEAGHIVIDPAFMA